MTVIRRDGLQWVAARGADAHAVPVGSTRTLCDQPALDARYAWPIGAFCPTCTRLAHERKADKKGAA